MELILPESINDPKVVEPDSGIIGLDEDLEGGNESESDGLDPLFGEGDQSAVKRALDFGELGLGFDATEDPDFETQTVGNKKRSNLEDTKEKKKKRKSKGLSSEAKPKVSKRKEKQEKEAHIAQLADFQRVMRERKCVGFKPVPMVEKPISSVLEKIRQRKLELSKKAMVSRTIQRGNSLMEDIVNNDTEEKDSTFEISDRRPEDATLTKLTADPLAMDISPSVSPGKARSNDKPCSNHDGASAHLCPVVEATQPFRAHVNDTQDLFSESQTSDTRDSQSNDDSGSAAEDIAPSLPSLNLKFDSALPDDISSDEEESDKENIEPHPRLLFKRNSSPRGDPVKNFVDEEALEDDSDNDLQNFPDKDEGGDSDIEEIKDYIAADCNEKAVDRERRNELHQLWLQQQDEAGTENLLHKLKYGPKQRELSLLEDDDDGRKEDEEDESDTEDTRDLFLSSGARMSTKKLRQMIPQMFADKDDGFVSSEDEETEKRLSKERLLQKVMLEEQSKFFSPAEDEASRDVFGRIKKLNTIPETKKMPKTTSHFDSLLMKGGSSNSLKSFLQRASNQPITSSLRPGPSTGRSFIFGRDDSNSRSSISHEEPSDVNQKENQVKKSASAKFVSSQAKWRTQQGQTGTEIVSDTSLFEILKHSSMQASHDAEENMVDHQAVFAAFKSVKKSVKIERRS